MCFVVPLHLLCSLELGLPWDPLAASYCEMALAQRSLTQPWCAGDKEGRRGKEESGSATPWREEFNADDLVKAFGGSHLVLGSSQVSVMHRAGEEPGAMTQNYHIFCCLFQRRNTMMCYPLVSCREEGLGTIIPTSGQVATSCELVSFSMT